MPYCSLLVIKNGTRRKIWENRYTDVAETAGMKFIKLTHINGYGDTDIGIRGFQGAEVSAGTMVGGERVNKFVIDKNELGRDCKSNRQLFFEPNDESGILEAWLPDTVLNRRVLASGYYHNPQCKIMNDKIDAEVQEQAKELGLEVDIEEESKVVLDTPEVKAMREEMDFQRRRIIDLEKDATNKNPIDPNQDKKNAKKNEDEKEKEKALRKIVRESVHLKHEDLINEIKANNPTKWHLSKDYRAKIAPIVKKELEERLNNADTSGTSSDN